MDLQLIAEWSAGSLANGNTIRPWVEHYNGKRYNMTRDTKLLWPGNGGYF